MTGSCPVSARVCRETARERDELSRSLDNACGRVIDLTHERDELRAEVKRLRRLAIWLTRLDEPDDIEERRTVTLTKIIDRARVALNPQGRRPEEGQPRPMPEFSPERARLLAERPAHPWTPPDGLALHRLEDVADEFGVDPTEGETDERR